MLQPSGPNNRSIEQARKDSLSQLVANHTELAERVKNGVWMTNNPDRYGTNGYGESMYPILRGDRIGVFIRVLNGSLFFPPGIQPGTTQINFHGFSQDLTINRDSARLLVAFMFDLQTLQQDKQTPYSPTELMNAMGGSFISSVVRFRIGKSWC